MAAVTKINWLNRGNAGYEFDTSGKVIAKELNSGKSILIDQSDFKNFSSLVGINFGIRFKKCECTWCSKEIAINNISMHELHCAYNPNKMIHPRIGKSLPECVRKKMKINHADVSGSKNPKAKLWILISPAGEETYINGSLNKTLQEKQLSRNHLVSNLGKVVEYSGDIRSDLTRNTLGWKLNLL
jgi:hypothetical protein